MDIPLPGRKQSRQVAKFGGQVAIVEEAQGPDHGSGGNGWRHGRVRDSGAETSQIETLLSLEGDARPPQRRIKAKRVHRATAGPSVETDPGSFHRSARWARQVVSRGRQNDRATSQGSAFQQTIDPPLGLLSAFSPGARAIAPNGGVWSRRDGPSR